jgi:VanZ family protein
MTGGAERWRVAAPVRRGGAGELIAAWAPVLLWMGVIFWLSGDQFSDERTAGWLSSMPVLGALGLPPAVIEVLNVIVRKSAHFVEYAVLSMLAYRALTASLGGRQARRALAGAVALAVLCAAADELHQGTTRFRTGSPKDVGLDSVGALAGALTGATFLYRRARRQTPM